MRRSVKLAGCAFLMAAAARAQAPTTTSTQMMAARPAPAALTGFRADYVADAERVGKKMIDLAEAMPADKYGWRPAAGVRSVGEVYVHVVASNNFYVGLLGGRPVEGVSFDSEKTMTDKAQIVAALKKSMESVRAAGAAVSDADMDRKVKLSRGRELTERGVMLQVLTHTHEHLGQSIAYARMNGVTPPWSQAE